MKLPRGNTVATERWRRVSRLAAATASTPAKVAAATTVSAGATGEGTPLAHDESAQPVGTTGSATARGVKTADTLPPRVFLVGTPAPERSAFGMRPMTTMAAKGPRKHQRHTRDMAPRLRVITRRESSGTDEGVC